MLDDAGARRGGNPADLTQLDQAASHRLTLVILPEGTGESSLLREWADTCHRRFAWLTLTADHNGPDRFVADLAAALTTLAPKITNAAPTGLQDSRDPLWEDAVVDLINALIDVPDDCFVVLANYHVIREQAVHRILEMLIDYLPPQAHLLVTAREEPPVRLSRLRVRRQLLTLAFNSGHDL